MRYKEIEVPAEQLAANASNNMLLLTSTIGILIGVALIVIGRKGKQTWMWVWGIGLIISSAYLGLSIAFGLRLFGNF